VADAVRLERRELVSWLGEVTTSGPLPDLFVERRMPDLLERSIDGLRAAPSFEELDPGCYSFFVDLNDPELTLRSRSLEVGAVVERIAETARSMRRRLDVEWNQPAGDVDQRTDALPSRPDGFDSFIVLENELQVPSIGPGGHVYVEPRNGTIFGSASVRPFSESRRPSTWGKTAAIVDELSPFFGSGIECVAEFGYYEGSWMERQSVIRPTFVFVIESEATAQFPLRRVVTLPATVGEESPPLVDRT
jgi:hypothetical protein